MTDNAPTEAQTGSEDRIHPGGRIVVHGVTLETEQLLARLHAEHGGELTRIAVEQLDTIGTFHGWAPLRTVTQWAYRAE